MKKSKIIKEIVGTRLKEYGFEFERTESAGVCFMREIEGFTRFYDPSDHKVRQHVLIQESRFAKEIVIRFSTDVYGKEVFHDLDWRKLVKEYPELTGGWLSYSDEVSYREALYKLADIFEKYGLGYLRELSVEDPVIPTKEMADNLYANHESLDKSFQEEFGVSAGIETEEDVDKCFAVIKDAVISVKDKEYEDVKERLLKTAAFLGERACEMLSQKWAFPDYFKTPLTKTVDYNGYYACKPLLTIVEWWKDGCKDDDDLLELHREDFKKALSDRQKA